MASDIIRSLTHRRNDSMRILNLYNVSEPLDVRVLENFKNIPNLKELILRQCKSVSDSELQVIIKYLIHLRKLVITTPFGSVSFFLATLDLYSGNIVFYLGPFFSFQIMV